MAGGSRPFIFLAEPIGRLSRNCVIERLVSRRLYTAYDQRATLCVVFDVESICRHDTTDDHAILTFYVGLPEDFANKKCEEGWRYFSRAINMDRAGASINAGMFICSRGDEVGMTETRKGGKSNADSVYAFEDTSAISNFHELFRGGRAVRRWAGCDLRSPAAGPDFRDGSH
eukprot:2711132-Pyramimonas_sp.AAC.2